MTNPGIAPPAMFGLSLVWACSSAENEGVASDGLLIVLAVRRSLHLTTWAYLTGLSDLLVIHLHIPVLLLTRRQP